MLVCIPVPGESGTEGSDQRGYKEERECALEMVNPRKTKPS